MYSYGETPIKYLIRILVRVLQTYHGPFRPEVRIFDNRSRIGIYISDLIFYTNMSENFDEQYLIWTIIGVAILTFLYSIFINQRFFAWFDIVFPLIGLYLFWRFVRAVERIAASMER